MEDIIDIIVTETTNLIEITSQASDEVIDVNIIDNREDITLNVTPTVVEININSLTGSFGVEWGDIQGTLSDQTDLNTALGLKADLVDGKVPSSQLPSYVDDIVEVANYAALPATGEVGKIYVVLDTNKIYRWSGSAYIEIADSTAVWGAITGTLSSQTDLQNALNAKFDDPTGDTTQYIAGDGSLITFPVAGQAGTLVREVRNTTGATLTKGTIVYISGATGNKPTVSKAIATGDSTSAQTFGMCQANISNNSNGYVVCVGDLGGLDTSALTEGAQLYLSSTTAGTYTTTKQLAPAHLVYIGVVTRAHPTQGQIEVNIQNGYELDEIHDVAISSKANNDGLFYESSTSLWKNKSIATVLGYTPANGANYLPLVGGTMTGAIVGTTASFAMSGSGIALGVTCSGTGDAIRITHSSGRALTLNSSGSGFGILINNDTAATSAPFTIQKQGASVITLTDAGAGTFASSLTASSFVKTSGTSAQFLKADGSVDSNTYATTSQLHNAVTLGTANGLSLSTQVLSLGLASSSANGALSATDWSTFNGKQAALSGTGFVKISGTTISYDNSTYLTTSSASSTYLPLSGGTLTGAVSGTRLTLVENSSNLALSIVQTGTGGGLSVLGTSYFSADIQLGSVTADSVLKTNGTGRIAKAVAGTDYVIPSALSSYLALTGGTLTGALSGTSATFSGTSASPVLTLANSSGGTKADFTITENTGLIINSYESASGRSIDFKVAGTSALTISSGGAATFSSSVTATKVGIGTTYIPSSKLLAVSGSAQFNGAALMEGANFSIVPAANGQDGVVLNVGYDTGLDYGSLFINTGGNTSMILDKNANATFSGSVTATQLILPSNAGSSGFLQFNYSSASASSRSWRIYNDTVAYGDLSIAQSTTQTGSSYNYLVTINPSGNVGIGTTSPLAITNFTSLEVKGTSSGLIGVSSAAGSAFGRMYNDGSKLIVGTSTNNILVFDTNDTERMRITSGGQVLLGTTTSYSNVRFQVASSGGSGNWISGTFAGEGSGDKVVIGNLTGYGASIGGHNSTLTAWANLYLNPDGGSVSIGTLKGTGSRAVLADANGFVTAPVSDKSVKQNIKPIGYGLNEIIKMNPVWFNFIDEYKNYGEGRQNGNIAQEMEKIIPEAVFITPSTNKMGINYEQLHGVYIKAIQELKAELDTLKNK